MVQPNPIDCLLKARAISSLWLFCQTALSLSTSAPTKPRQLVSSAKTCIVGWSAETSRSSVNRIALTCALSCNVKAGIVQSTLAYYMIPSFFR